MRLETADPSDFALAHYPLLYKGAQAEDILRSVPTLHVGQIWLVEFRNAVVEVGPVLDVQRKQAQDVLAYLLQRLGAMNYSTQNGLYHSAIQRVYLIVDPINGGGACTWAGKVVR